jgi:hypothetical protein
MNKCGEHFCLLAPKEEAVEEWKKWEPFCPSVIERELAKFQRAGSLQEGDPTGIKVTLLILALP